MSTSVREYAVLYLGGKSKPGGTGTILGGNAILAAGQHRLDGPEHATATDGTRLDATVDEHGLLPKLSGDPIEFLAGDGTFAVPLAEELATEELDTTLVASPDGYGGIMFRAESSGGGGPGPSTFMGPLLVNNPAIVTTDGTAVYVPLTTMTGEPVFIEYSS